MSGRKLAGILLGCAAVVGGILVTVVVQSWPGAHAPLGVAPRTCVVQEGDTLSAIAARELGDASRWCELAQLNGIIDPDRIFPGSVLVLEEVPIGPR